MRVNRTLLYAGIFLVAIGGTVVAADLGFLDQRILSGALNLWSLAVIAVGLGLVLRRTRIGLGGGMLAAAVPGLLIGSAFAVAPTFGGFCGAGDGPAGAITRQGIFEGPASISVTIDCGSLDVATAPGSGWQLDLRDGEGRVPVVDATARSLSIASAGHDGWPSAGGDDWALALPTSDIGGLSLVVSAGRGDINLSGARIDRLSVTANAADVVVDASGASVANLSGEVHVGMLSIRLPAAGDLVGSLDVGAGKVQVCAPPDLGLRITSSGDALEITVAGRDEAGSDWQSANYESAEHRADLAVHVDFGAIEINPIGGCS